MGHNLKTSTITKNKFIQESQIFNDYKKTTRKILQIAKKSINLPWWLSPVGCMIHFRGLKISVCYSSCALERRKFQKSIDKRIIANVRDIVDVTCRLSQLFLRLQRGQVSSTFCIRRGMKTVAAHFKITHCITLKCFYYDGCKDWK